MKRSAGVTAASICVIVASVAWCVYVLWSLPPTGREGVALLLAGSIFTLLFGVWGIATGIALLRLRRWAWACLIVISGVMILFSAPELLRAPKLIRATTGVPTVGAGHFISSQYFDVIALGIVPVVLGIWWLVFFLLPSVRAQFAPAVPSTEASFAPARSGAVDASVIVLLFGSALVLLLALMMPLTATAPTPSAPPLPFRGILIATGVLYLLAAAWGIVTAIGALKRRAWGRILMIVTAALGIAFTVLGSFGVIMAAIVTPSNPLLPAAVMRDTIITGTLVMLIPLGISIWWLILFTRPRIALEFASPSAASLAAPGTSMPLVDAEAKPAAPVPVQFNTSLSSAQPPMPLARPQIPMSIRVIAVVEILLGALAFFGPLQARFIGMRPPLLIFGFLVHGWGVDAFYFASGILPILFCIGILLRKRWGLDALIGFLLAMIVDYALFFFSSQRARFDAEIQAQVQTLTSQIKMPDGSSPPSGFPFAHMNMLQNFGFGVTIALFAVLLYFLFTRRRAFRAACVSNRS